MKSIKKLIYRILAYLTALVMIANVGWFSAKYVKKIENKFSLMVEEKVEEEPEPSEPFILVDANGNPNETGGYILFGSYPQVKADANTSSELSSNYAQQLPSDSNDNGWKSYEYYQGTGTANTGTTETDFMWYKDVTHKGKKYRGVYFTHYRPKFTYKKYDNKSDTTKTESTMYLQYTNGYIINTVYWFKYDWIKWKIIENNGDGTAVIFAEDALDSMHFYNNTIKRGDINANNYAESDIRKWLNEDFYNASFDDNQVTFIEDSIVDNSKPTTNNCNNVCEDTVDKLFLLSYTDATTKYGFDIEGNRAKFASDYAMCQGVATGDYNGNGLRECDWMTRSPTSTTSVSMVRGDAQQQAVGSTTGFSCNGTSYGIIPALTINLSGVFGLLEEESVVDPVEYEINVDDSLEFYTVDNEDIVAKYGEEMIGFEWQPYAGFDFSLGFIEPYPKSIVVEIDGTTIYDVPMNGEVIDDEPFFDIANGILTIPAGLLTEETISLVITASAVEIAEQDDEEKTGEEPTDEEKTDEEKTGEEQTDEPSEEQNPTEETEDKKDDITEEPMPKDEETDNNNAESTMQNAEIKAEVENAEVVSSTDENANIKLVIKADEGYSLPETFIITIGGTEYEIDTAAAEQEGGIVWDSETGTLTIPKDLVNGENAEIGVKLQAIIKEDDDEETDNNSEEDKKPDGDDSNEDTDDTTSGGTEGGENNAENDNAECRDDVTDNSGENTETDTPVIPPVTDGEQTGGNADTENGGTTDNDGTDNNEGNTENGEQTGGNDGEENGGDNAPPAAEETPIVPPVTDNGGTEETGGETCGEDTNPVIPNDKTETPGDDNKGEDTSSGSIETEGTDDTVSGGTESGNDNPQGDTSASGNNDSTGESTDTSGSTTSNAPAAPSASESTNNGVAAPTAPSTSTGTPGSDSSQGNSQGSGTTSSGDGSSSSSTSTGTTFTVNNATAKKQTETTGSTGGDDSGDGN